MSGTELQENVASPQQDAPVPIEKENSETQVVEIGEQVEETPQVHPVRKYIGLCLGFVVEHVILISILLLFFLVLPLPICAIERAH